LTTPYKIDPIQLRELITAVLEAVLNRLDDAEKEPFTEAVDLAHDEIVEIILARLEIDILGEDRVLH
jgi:hypothetical protein